jgi:RHS repeat-associated protein
VQGRLTDVSRDGAAFEHYGYDLNGNRTTATVDGTTVNPTYDEQDRLLTYGGTTFAYTANGELRTKTDSTGTTTYTYDAVGSLIAVSLPDGRLIEYVTDGRGRRIGKMVNGVLVKQWLYHNYLKPIAELDGTGNLMAQYVYGSKSNLPDLVIRGGDSLRVISDQLDSPVMAVNTANSSDISFLASYSAFGNRTLIAGTDDWMPFGFAGGIYDPDTKLTRFGARDYDPQSGRWLSKEPVRFLGKDPNLDPINGRDLTGLETYVCRKPLDALGGTDDPTNQRNGPDMWGNPLYHQYICVVQGNNVICGGQSGGGKPYGSGAPSRDSFGDNRCEPEQDDNTCLESRLASKILSPSRPYYGLVGPGTNCQEWADDTMSQCKSQCGAK